MPELTFHKMQALGNDFILIDCRGANSVAGASIPFVRLADRRMGIGCDQFLLLEDAPSDSDASVACSFVNSDGGLAGQCGNGLRSIALYMQKSNSDGSLQVLCSGKIFAIEALADDFFRVDMGAPVFAAKDIPVAAGVHELQLGQDTWPFTAVAMGNPHAVINVQDVAKAPLARIAASPKWQDLYPEGVNVGVMQVERKDSIRLRVHERGAGETPACGTGACAAVAAGRYNGLLDCLVCVQMPGGSVTVEWQGAATDSVWMTGTASYVYEGRIQL